MSTAKQYKLHMTWCVLFYACCRSVSGYSPMWAWDRCRISPPHFLAMCHKKRLNTGIILFCCVLRCLLFWVVFSFCIACILICLVLYFPVRINVNGNVWLIVLIWPLRIYSLTHCNIVQCTLANLWIFTQILFAFTYCRQNTVTACTDYTESTKKL